VESQVQLLVQCAGNFRGGGVCGEAFSLFKQDTYLYMIETDKKFSRIQPKKICCKNTMDAGVLCKICDNLFQL